MLCILNKKEKQPIGCNRQAVFASPKSVFLLYEFLICITL